MTTQNAAPKESFAVNILLVFVALALAVLGHLWLGHWTLEQQEKLWLGVRAIDFVQRPLATLVIFALLRLTCQLFIRYYLKAKVEVRRGTPLPSLLIGFTKAGFAIVGGVFFFVLNTPGILGFIAAGSGVAVFVVGIAVKNMILDSIAGMAIDMERPFQIGDRIQVMPRATRGKFKGEVKEMNWRAIRIKSASNEIMVIPNGVLAVSAIVNFTQPTKEVKRSILVTLDHTVPPARAKRIFMSALLATPGLFKAKKPTVNIKMINQTGVVYTLGYWIPESQKALGIKTAVTEKVLLFLNQAGLSPAISSAIQINTTERPSTLERRSDLDTLLRRTELFFPLTGTELNDLAKEVQIKEVAVNKFICRAGEEGDALYIVAEGLLEVLVANSEGAPEQVALIEPGSCVGEMSLLTGEPRKADVKTLTEAILIRVGKDDLKPLLEERPELAESLAGTMAKRLAPKASEKEKKVVEETQKSIITDLTAKIKHFFRLKG